MTRADNASTHTLDEDQRATLDAIVARVIPSDALGPGAFEAGVGRYIEDALGGDYRDLLPLYAGALSAVNAWATERHGGVFAELRPEDQDTVLRDCEAGRIAAPTGADPAFFEILLRHVMEGMFGDPGWGGNVDRIGWELLGYRGPRFEWTELDQRLDADPAQGPGLAHG